MNPKGYKSPCYHCKKRHPNCHNASCQEWVEFSKFLEEKRKERRSQAEIEYNLSSISVKRYDRINKKH